MISESVNIFVLFLVALGRWGGRGGRGGRRVRTGPFVIAFLRDDGRTGMMTTVLHHTTAYKNGSGMLLGMLASMA